MPGILARGSAHIWTHIRLSVPKYTVFNFWHGRYGFYTPSERPLMTTRVGCLTCPETGHVKLTSRDLTLTRPGSPCWRVGAPLGSPLCGPGGLLFLRCVVVLIWGRVGVMTPPIDCRMRRLMWAPILAQAFDIQYFAQARYWIQLRGLPRKLQAESTTTAPAPHLTTC